MRITKKVVDAAVGPEKGELRIRDDGIPGFYLRVTKRTKTYALRYGTGSRGAERWITIGEHGKAWRPGPDGQGRPLTADLARDEAMRLRGLVVAGEDPAAARNAAGGVPLLEVFAERYMREHVAPHRAAGTAAAYQRNLDTHILPALGKRRLSEITMVDVTRWHLSIETTTAANRSLATLSHIFTMARKWGVLEQAHPHPCRDVARHKEQRRQRYLSPDELARVGPALAAALHGRGRSAVEALYALLFTGARVGEIVSLRWDEVAWNAAGAGLAMKKRKHRGRTPLPIHLPPPLVSILKEITRLHGNPYLFPGRPRKIDYVKDERGKRRLKKNAPPRHLTETGLTQRWGLIRATIGLEDVHLHDLRHSFASVAAGGGKSLPIIGALLGHTQAQTTARYAHLANSPLAKAADETASTIDDALKGKGGG